MSRDITAYSIAIAKAVATLTPVPVTGNAKGRAISAAGARLAARIAVEELNSDPSSVFVIPSVGGDMSYVVPSAVLDDPRVLYRGAQSIKAIDLRIKERAEFASEFKLRSKFRAFKAGLSF